MLKKYVNKSNINVLNQNKFEKTFYIFFKNLDIQTKRLLTYSYLVNQHIK